MRSSLNEMNCVEFGFDRSSDFGSVRGQFWLIAIDRPTRPYNIASTTVQQMTCNLCTITYQFVLSVKEDSNDNGKTANINVLTCHDGFFQSFC
jgi:hypothetical protein